MRERYESLILNHPALVMVAAVVATAFFAYMLRGLSFSSSTDKFFVAGAPEKVDFERAKDYFGSDQVIVIAMVTPEGESIYTSARLTKLRQLTAAVRAVDGVDNSVSLTNVPSISAPCDPGANQCEKRIEIKALINEVPPNDDYSSAAWQAIFADVERTPLYEGNLVSRAARDEQGRLDPRGARAAAVLAFIREFNDPRRNREVIDGINAVVAGFAGVDEFYLAGIPLTRVATEERMVSDLKRLLPLTVLVFAALLVVSFRSVKGLALPLVTIVAITVWTMGFMEVAGIPITLVTVILPPLMLALGSSFAIHMMSEYFAQSGPGRGAGEVVKDTLGKVALPVMVCGFTTMIGFASLAINRIPAIQDLGLAAAVGIFISVVVSLFVLPASLMLLKKPGRVERKETEPGALDRFLHGLAEFNARRRITIFTLAALLVLGSLFGIARIKINTDFLSFFEDDDPVMVAANVQAEHLAGAAPFNIVFEADRADVFKHPAMLSRIDELQRWAEDPANVGGIDSTVSIADFIKLFNQALMANDPDYRRIPDTREELAPIIGFFPTREFSQYVVEDYSAANVLIRSRLVGSSETNHAIEKIETKARELFQAPARNRLSPDGSGFLSLIPTIDELSDVEEVIYWPGDQDPTFESVDGATAGAGAGDALDGNLSRSRSSKSEFHWPKVKVYVTGAIYLLNKSADAVSRGQVLGLFAALAGIFVVMSLLFLSPRIGVLAMLPNLFPIFMLFGLMGFTGITLNFSTSLIAAIALGIGVDDTIHFINRYNQEVRATRDQKGSMTRALATIGKPMIFTTLALFFAFGIFLDSDFIPIRQFGLLTAITLLMALTSNLVILPSLMISVRIVTLWDLIGLTIGDNPAHYIQIFHGLSNWQARIAVLNATLQTYDDGTVIFQEGDEGKDMYVIIKGQVDIVIGAGDEALTLATTMPGEAFGEMALLRHRCRTAAAVARGEVVLFVMSEQTLLRLHRRFPRLSSIIYANISKMLADRLQAANVRVYEGEAPGKKHD